MKDLKIFKVRFYYLLVFLFGVLGSSNLFSHIEQNVSSLDLAFDQFQDGLYVEQEDRDCGLRIYRFQEKFMLRFFDNPALNLKCPSSVKKLQIEITARDCTTEMCSFSYLEQGEKCMFKVCSSGHCYCQQKKIFFENFTHDLYPMVDPDGTPSFIMHLRVFDEENIEKLNRVRKFRLFRF